MVRGLAADVVATRSLEPEGVEFGQPPVEFELDLTTYQFRQGVFPRPGDFASEIISMQVAGVLETWNWFSVGTQNGDSNVSCKGVGIEEEPRCLIAAGCGKPCKLRTSTESVSPDLA